MPVVVVVQIVWSQRRRPHHCLGKRLARRNGLEIASVIVWPLFLGDSRSLKRRLIIVIWKIIIFYKIRSRRLRISLLFGKRQALPQAGFHSTISMA